MKSLRHMAEQPAAVPLVADDVLEFHAGRLMLLFYICGGAATAINGLTKMAKLDFFVRYPDFFDVAVNTGGSALNRSGAVEAAMVRHHYGPWDKRYYHVLAYLESRGLVTIKSSGKLGNSFRISLTKNGKSIAHRLSESPAFSGLRKHMETVFERLGARSGNQLKKLIYSTFDDEVASKPLGHIIGEVL